MALPVTLLGAYDRHNFGDLLLARIAARLSAPREGRGPRGLHELRFAGLAARDLRGHGGVRVAHLADTMPAAGEPPRALLHVGGQLLSCSAWQAAAMLLPPDEAAWTIGYLAARPVARRRWVRAVLRLDDHAPYLLPRALAHAFQPVLALGLGGAGLERCPRRMQNEVMEKLGAMDRVAVRDARTLALLRDAGVSALLLPDPAVLTARLFGPAIRARAARGEVAALRSRFPGGYLAVQLAAEFGDDATLDALAPQLDAVARERGLALLLFRAGAAPWHDDEAVLNRLSLRLDAPRAVMRSLHLWDICALLAGSAGYCGSSLHGRIVATAFGRPRLNLLPPQGNGDKHAAYVESWELPGLPGCVEVGEVKAALRAALDADGGALRVHGRALAALFMDGFNREFEGPLKTRSPAL